MPPHVHQGTRRKGFDRTCQATYHKEVLHQTLRPMGKAAGMHVRLRPSVLISFHSWHSDHLQQFSPAATTTTNHTMVEQHYKSSMGRPTRKWAAVATGATMVEQHYKSSMGRPTRKWAAVATGASCKIGTRHAFYTWKGGSLSFISTHPLQDLTKKKHKKNLIRVTVKPYTPTVL